MASRMKKRPSLQASPRSDKSAERGQGAQRTQSPRRKQSARPKRSARSEPGPQPAQGGQPARASRAPAAAGRSRVATAGTEAAPRSEESVSNRVLGAIDVEAAELVRGYLSEPLLPTDVLAEQTRLYYQRLEALAEDGEVIDLDLATELAVRCERLLDEMDDDRPEEHRRLVQAAVLYFVNDEDADADAESLIGFDDDLSVIEAVALAIGCGHVLESSID